MEKHIRPGRIISAIGIIGLGVLCILSKDFIFGRPPVAKWAADIPGKLPWAYISGSVTILCGLAILIKKRAAAAALIVGFMILVFSFLLRHLYEMTDWVGAYKALALAGGSFIIAASARPQAGRPTGLSANGKLVFAGTLSFSLFFTICGIAHFKFSDFIIKGFMPRYIPYPAFWAYFCGVCLMAAGTGLLFPQTRKWAALFAAIMIAGWFVLLHTVRFMSDISNTGDRLGLAESFTFVGMLCVLAGTFAKKTVVI